MNPFCLCLVTQICVRFSVFDVILDAASGWWIRSDGARYNLEQSKFRKSSDKGLIFLKNASSLPHDESLYLETWIHLRSFKLKPCCISPISDQSWVTVADVPCLTGATLDGAVISIPSHFLTYLAPNLNNDKGRGGREV